LFSEIEPVKLVLLFPKAKKNIATIMTANRQSTTSIIPEEELSQIDPNRIPHHIAIIMDGNRRWAKREKRIPFSGHLYGAETLLTIVKEASLLGVKVLTVFAFSTENNSRSTEEIDALMDLFEKYLLEKRALMQKEGIRLDAIGDIDSLPKRVKDAFYETKRATSHGKKIDLVLALNYGARDEIKRAVEKMLCEDRKNPFPKERITEELFASYLDTAKWKDPDLMIRTSGEIRLSNFLLYQLSYAEVYVTDVLWPDFSKKHLYEAVYEFQKREQRRGK
jgi:undecaprenyl diphosphate synthase